MLIKRQPFWVAVRAGLWLHLALAGIFLFQSWIPQNYVPALWGLGFVVDWIVGSIYSRDYLKTWPVQLLSGTWGAMLANLLARCAAAVLVGIAYFISYSQRNEVPLTVELRWSLSTAGMYVLWGLLVGAISGAWTIVRNKGVLSLTQTSLIFISIFSLCASQYTYINTSNDLYPRLTPAGINLFVAGLSVFFGFYLHNKTDRVDAPRLGQLLLFTFIGVCGSLFYAYIPQVCCEGSPIKLYGFPFGASFIEPNLWTILLDCLFWFNISFLLVGLRNLVFVRSRSFE